MHIFRPFPLYLSGVCMVCDDRQAQSVNISFSAYLGQNVLQLVWLFCMQTALGILWIMSGRTALKYFQENVRWIQNTSVAHNKLGGAEKHTPCCVNGRKGKGQINRTKMQVTNVFTCPVYSEESLDSRGLKSFSVNLTQEGLNC